MPQSFDILAAKALAGEASDAELSQLRELLVGNAELRGEYEQLKEAWNMMQEIGPAAEAMHAPPRPLPNQHLEHLEEVVRRKFKTGLEVTNVPSRSDAVARPPTSQPSDNRKSELSGVIFAQLWKRLAQNVGSPAAWAMAAAGLLLLLGLVLLLMPSRSKDSSVPSQTAIVAYILETKGTLEIRRQGKSLPFVDAMPLHGSDQIRLGRGASAQLIGPTGIVELRGPRRLLATSIQNNSSVTAPSTASGPGTAVSSEVIKRFRSILFPKDAIVPSAAILVATRSALLIPLYSPLEATAYSTPAILWKSEPGKTYDLLITDEFNPNASPLRLEGVVPPVEFNRVEAWKGRALGTDGLYQLTLQEAGKPFTACQYSFRTLKEAAPSSPSAPREKLLECYRLLSVQPERLGDALADLLSLPPVDANGELALRLKLCALAQAGYREDYETSAAKLQQLLQANTQAAK